MHITARQEVLLAKCAAVLGVDSLSSDEDFYGVGGDSLDAAEMSEMLTAEAGREISMETVMRSATFGDMLKSLEG